MRVPRAGAQALEGALHSGPAATVGCRGHLSAPFVGLRGVARTSPAAATGTIGRPRSRVVIPGPERHRAAPIAAARGRRVPPQAM